MIKIFVRNIAKYAYRRLKIIARPIAFRVRKYLLDELRQEIKYETHRASAATVQALQLEIHKASAAAMQEIQSEISKITVATEQKIHHELHRASAAAVQEIQRETHKVSVIAAKEMQHEIYKASAAVVQEIKSEICRVSAEVAKEIQHETYKTFAAAIQEAQHEIHQALIAATQKNQRDIQIESASMIEGIQLRMELLAPRLDRIEQYSFATARRVAINCGAGEVLLRTEVGFLLCSASDHALLACLMDSGDLELGTRLLIQKFLKPGDVYVDVGANIGMHTLAAARAMQGQGRIIAFEPFEPTMRLLEKSVWMNGFSDMTKIHQAAVSNIDGHQQLFMGATSGHHSLFALNATPNNLQGPVDVPLVRLDSVIASGQQIDLIKIDAEGAELEVIEGGVASIAGNPDIALIVEFGPSHLRRVGWTPSQWFAVFSRLGFDYRVINHESGALESWSLEALEQAESVNLFFSRPESAAWGRLS